MEAETIRKIEETVKDILREADLDDMTEFKLRVAASSRLGLDVSGMEQKKLIRHVLESFLLSTADGESPVTGTAAAVKKEVGGGEDERIICKLSEKQNAVVQRYRGKAFLSIGERSQGNGTQPPTFNGVHLSTDQWSVMKSTIPAIEEAIKKLQSKSRSQSTHSGDASDAVDDKSHEFFPVKTNRFDGKNYLCWVSEMEIFLKQLNLAYVLTEPCPSSSRGPQTNPEETTRSKAAEQNWLRDDYLCHHHLLNSLSDHLYHQYSKKFKSAKELWDELKWVYQFEESSSRSQVRKYIEFKMVEERPIIEQVQDFNKIADNIVSAGMFLDENFHISAIISKFPPSWKGFCIKLMQEEFLPVWMLMEHVKAEEEFRRYGTRRDISRLTTNFHMERRTSTGTRHKGTQNIGWKRKEPERDGRPIIVCNNCGRKGHLTKDCWGKKMDKRAWGKPNGDTSAAVPLVSETRASPRAVE